MSKEWWKKVNDADKKRNSFSKRKKETRYEGILKNETLCGHIENDEDS